MTVNYNWPAMTIGIVNMDVSYNNWPVMVPIVVVMMAMIITVTIISPAVIVSSIAIMSVITVSIALTLVSVFRSPIVGPLAFSSPIPSSALRMYLNHTDHG